MSPAAARAAAAFPEADALSAASACRGPRREASRRQPTGPRDPMRARRPRARPDVRDGERERPHRDPGEQAAHLERARRAAASTSSASDRSDGIEPAARMLSRPAVPIERPAPSRSHRRARRPSDAGCVASTGGGGGRSSPWSVRNWGGTADGALQSTVASDEAEPGFTRGERAIRAGAWPDDAREHAARARSDPRAASSALAPPMRNDN